ncbi:glutathione peroxidase [Halomonas sp. JS92-SW72]|uniref:glutathione peroxidase n=1 Tax=Halomonas sp. JS92-SW72 TaxID=2306583 RepID=UPI001F099A02|nr:glutathione peroxidase [Halomonas sp. JS92-SW72]
MWTPTLPAMTFYCLTLAAALVAGPVQADPDALLDHDLRRLHSSEVVNLKERMGGSPLLLVNTASRCGFTGQFEGLEALHQRYAEHGLKVAGFSSNDFNQEIDEEGAAEVCFINFGVTFDMFAPIPVRGPEAHPLFTELARQSEAPGWNFTKYLVDESGRVVAHFPSRVRPESPAMREAIETLLAGE